MGKIPDRWLQYKPVSEVIPGTRFIAFKVPLRESVNENVDEDKRLSPQLLLQMIPNLGLVIDLTNSLRYYSPKDFLDKGIQHKKIMVPGHVVPPLSLFEQFATAVKNFTEKNLNNDKLIGVHCTHGLNRTGYFICKYMISQMGIPPSTAIESFNCARNHEMERQNYINALNHTSYRKNKKKWERRKEKQEELRKDQSRKDTNSNLCEKNSRYVYRRGEALSNETRKSDIRRDEALTNERREEWRRDDIRKNDTRREEWRRNDTRGEETLVNGIQRASWTQEFRGNGQSDGQRDVLPNNYRRVVRPYDRHGYRSEPYPSGYNGNNYRNNYGEEESIGFLRNSSRNYVNTGFNPNATAAPYSQERFYSTLSTSGTFSNHFVERAGSGPRVGEVWPGANFNVPQTQNYSWDSRLQVPRNPKSFDAPAPVNFVKPFLNQQYEDFARNHFGPY